MKIVPNISTILLVDDQPSILEVLTFILEPEGYCCLHATSGSQALEILAQKSVDLVLTDIQMPGMNGLQLLEQVSVRWPDIVRIAITGHANNHDSDEAINQGLMQACIEKPWNNASLLRAVDTMIRDKREHKDRDTSVEDEYPANDN